MSIWTDIHRRSNGNQARKEDYLDIYHHESMIKTLHTDAYAGCATYEIITNGAYPAIMITFYGDYILNSIDRQVVKLKAPDNKYYDLFQCTFVGSDGRSTLFSYAFNKDDDYVNEVDDDFYNKRMPPHPGHKYSIVELKKYADMFIELLINMNTEINKMKKYEKHNYYYTSDSDGNRSSLL